MSEYADGFVQGQRWISSTEPELGLGIITQTQGRLIQIFFPAAAEERAYAARNAPLSRVAFRAGDVIRDDKERRLVVLDVHENRGLLIYLCEDAEGSECLLPEMRLHGVIRLSSPRERLFTGQIDRLSRYRLRYQSRLHQGMLRQSGVEGLIGPRVQLLPHQVYIAHEVARRYAPRVLLADEVGLGKTIEAGLIVHQLLLRGRIGRVLIVVPEALQHQWLVEMLRRFNLRFSLLDEERCEAVEESAEGGDEAPNPFEDSQLVLCSQQWLTGSEQRREQAIAAGWDLLLVDEAHHLQWSRKESSPAYRCIEALAAQVPALLLLTATPEQMGGSGHFARLRLLDPQRYHDLDAFLAEESRYAQVSEVLIALQAEDAWERLRDSADLRSQLDDYLGADHVEQALAQAAQAEDPAAVMQALVREILDRHGTGRVLFRNTRAAVEGFPGRELHAWPQQAPVPDARPDTLEAALRPETVASENWTARDPRVSWLVDFLRGHREDKCLLICASAQTALALEQHLRFSAGLQAGVFHEDMSLVERDRVAAWFADAEGGAQILLCSEIGSEGRNFQFARHLVLFDLPLDPDLLEQRIGRLDRIGQAAVVQIHVPYFEGTAQEGLLRWYRDGLGAFERPFPAADRLRSVYGRLLEQTLLNNRAEALEQLIEETRQYTASELERLEAGRDRLLEMNSLQPEAAERLVMTIREHERSGVLMQYMEQVFDEFGVEHESHSADAIIARPGQHMHVPHFPALPDEGITGTFRREMAMSREDMAFLSWEHPMVRGVMDMILSGDTGNTSLCTVKLGGIAPGTVLVEAVFVLQAQAPRSLQLGRYLPAEPLRLLRDSQGRDLSEAVNADQLHQLGERVPKHTAHALVKKAKPVLRQILEQLESQAESLQDDLISSAQADMLAERSAELKRLQALARVNPGIRAEEIEAYREETAGIGERLGQAQLQLDAIRVVVAT